MASVLIHPLLFFFLLLLHTSFSLLQTPEEFPPSILLPLSKDRPSGQHLARIHHGNPPGPAQLVLDLGSPSVWTDCASSRPTSLPCRSIQCSAATSASCRAASSAVAPPPCTLSLQNPVTGESATGELVEDGVVLALDDEGPIATVDQFLMSCAPSVLLKGLASGARGVLGCGRARIGAPEQICHSFGYSKKFSLCLSSSNGMIFSGENFSKSLIYTPLLNGDDYSINLKAIQIQSKKLSLGLPDKISQFGSIKVSTISQYSTMKSEIYRVFLRAFTVAAESQNLSLVQPIAPFGACFRSGPSGSVPVIDLLLQSEIVKWRIHGHNSMVKVNDDVMCLGFLDGG
ncbi:hypothetical protein Cgig2_016583 [Carnegiea gigantea]|uniref:Peptidase A1 domain-containing protein n=1 Tax=Carnegiea gigantea TaxID=171969 RepID=A0A9Q1KYE2_9CARY|nr:hypothetical protein Cgig2_016583 [Carnegiea gigantea]